MQKHPRCGTTIKHLKVRWYNRKNPYDYGVDFNDCWEKDTAAMVNRDFNHPGVILYSIGNEVAEPFEQKGI